MRRWKLNRKRSLEKNENQKTEEISEYFTGEFSKDLEAIKQEIGHNYDVRFHEFNLGSTDTRAAIIFIEGLSDRQLIDRHILKTLIQPFSENTKRSSARNKDYFSQDYIKNHILSISEVKEIETLQELVTNVLMGQVALLVDRASTVLILGTTKGKTRKLTEPPSEESIRGPRIGFTEKLSDNSALLRSSGKNEKLTLEKYEVGERSRKDLVVAYIEDIVDPQLVKEVDKRIQKIDIDNVVESGFVEQLIEDDYLSPFPQVQNTERPDRVMSALMEGRVAILLDGTPFALIVPVTFSMMFQAPEDYYERWIPGSLVRLLRFFAAFISLFGPSLYIAFISFHQGLIPTDLAITVLASRDGVPFPSIIEALIMEIAIEILREAGLRLPSPIGQTIGIVGALIVGEAAVQAGIVSPMMVIVVAITAISSFTIPQYSVGISLRFLRFGSMIFAAILGLYGVILFFLFLCSHFVKLQSFGVPFASPFVPYRISDWKDLFIRMPLKMMKRRPKMLHPKDQVRKK
ncbi:spore germination protein [Halobacillus sp. A5]|uniref:spore germination protein n=1 Tax=Halobacillus sp. A5 TaxID=2880263 RepID=UPI0020A69479|nr:spore germination protein [Halobacillus sp. A5]MCP3028976.1 spore germination protein [Halobacillus sp. A5]